MASYTDFLPVVASGGVGWQRPSDWLPMPTVTDVEQKFVGLHGVWEDGDNVVAFLFQGAYTVDWGDGMVENVASNVKAEHQYDWATIPAGTLTSQGYRQVLITVTPNASNLTNCNFQQRYTGRNQAYSTGFMDVTLSMPNANTAASITFGGTTVNHRNLERATFVTIGGATSMLNMFNNCTSLQSVPLFNTASVTSMHNMFFGCSSLQSVPFFNTAIVTNMTGMFNGSTSLQSVPFFNTINVQTVSGMFNVCSSLTSLPLFNFSNCTVFTEMLRSCSIRSIPLWDTSKAVAMNNMFRTAPNIESIPALSTAATTTVAGSDFSVNFAPSCLSLARCEMVFARTVGFASCNLSAPAIVEIFNNLVDRTATTAATITITSNWGAALLTTIERDIALNKNWTITG